MQWKNKGHEFDELGNIFKKKKNIIIIGTQEKNKVLTKKLRFLKTNIKTYTDIPHKKLLKNTGENLNFFNKIRNKLFAYQNENIILLTNDMDGNHADAILEELVSKYNYELNVSIFWADEFMGKYLSIYAVYAKNKVYFTSTCLICTTVCTLNCEACLNFAPYDKNKKHIDLDVLKKDVDLYFSCVDRVGLFHISGGEPFSYPHLGTLIQYIYDNYSDKIDVLGSVTNGTIQPSDELCTILKKCNVVLEIDDYTKSVPRIKTSCLSVIEKLQKLEVNIHINFAGECWTWFSIFPPRNPLTNVEDSVLINKYEKCNNPFQGLRDKKLHGCCYAEFSNYAGVFPEVQSDCYDLETFTPSKKKELVEFRLRYLERGFVEFCKYCNGYHPINKINITPAIQAEKNLEWDINNPTEVKISAK